MGKGRPLGDGLLQSMINALKDLKNNNDQTINDVADRHHVSRGHFRDLVRSRGYQFKHVRMRISGRGSRPRTAEQEAQRLSNPAYRKPPKQVRTMWGLQQEALRREQESTPPIDRAQLQLSRRFEELAALWGDWIKK